MCGNPREVRAMTIQSFGWRWRVLSPARWFGNARTETALRTTRSTLHAICLVSSTALLVPSAGSAQEKPAKKIGVGLYGSNGHQINVTKFEKLAAARLVAVAGVKQATLPDGVKRYASLDELIADPT